MPETSVWRVMRFEHGDGRWCELASNHLKPDQIGGLPVGFQFVSSTPMVPRAELDVAVAERDRLQAAVDAAHSAMVGSEYVGGPSEREAWQTIGRELGPLVTQHQGQQTPDA